MSDEHKTTPTLVLHRDISTQNQMGTLLAVVANMTELLINPARDTDIIPGARPLPGEARIAAEATLIKACDRLDRMIDDSQRWSMDFQLALEKGLMENQIKSQKVMEEQIATLKADRERAIAGKIAAEEIESPHARYKPSLYPIDGGWLAMTGDPNNLKSGIGGLGKSPEAALQDFDNTFRGKPSHAWLAFLEDNKQTEKHETNQSLDEGRGSASGKGPETEQEPSGSRQSPETQH